MKPKDFITQIQRIADTDPRGSHITAPDVQRVISVASRLLANLSATDSAETVAKLIKQGAAANEKKGTKGLKPRKK